MNVLSMDFYKDFVCTGTDCECTCCQGWAIEIDKKSYERYKEFQGDFANKVRKSIIEIEHGYYIDLDKKTGRCPLLNDKNLCDVYINFGEENMSDLCKKFPRSEWVVGNWKYLGLDMSCYEVAKKVLFHEGLISFSVDELSYLEGINADPYLEEALFAGLNVSVDIVQNRKIGINKRLQLLILFNNQFQEIIKNRADYSDVISMFSNPDMINAVLKSIEKITPTDTDLENMYYIFIKNNVDNIITPWMAKQLKEYCENYSGNNQTLAQVLEENSVAIENYVVHYILAFYMKNYYKMDIEFTMAVLVFLLVISNTIFMDKDDMVRTYMEVARPYEHVSKKQEELFGIYETAGYTETSFLLRLLA